MYRPSACPCHLSVRPSHTYLQYILSWVPYLLSNFKPICLCTSAHTTRRHYFLFVPRNKEEESRKELAQDLLSSQPLVASIFHKPVGRTVRMAAPSAWGREGGWAGSGIPQPCSKTDSVPASPSAKPSVHVRVRGKGEKGFPPVDSTYLLRIRHSFSRSEICYGQAGIVSLGVCDYNPKL